MFFSSREQQEEFEARSTSGYLRIFGLFDTLDPDQIEILLVLIANSASVAGYGERINGVLTGYLRLKHNLCGCIPGLSYHAVSDHNDPDWITQQQSQPAPAEASEEQPVDFEAAMVAYGLVASPTETSPDRVRCIGCGIEYVSLDDRMLKPPGVEGCSGCQVAGGHGGGDPWKGM